MAGSALMHLNMQTNLPYIMIADAFKPMQVGIKNIEKWVRAAQLLVINLQSVHPNNSQISKLWVQLLGK